MRSNLLYFLASALIAVLSLAGWYRQNRKKTGNLVAEQIQIKELPALLNRLKNKETEFDFIGITSKDIDCIYVTIGEDGLYGLEYSAIIEEQLPYVEPIIDLAARQHYPATVSDSSSGLILTIPNRMALSEVVALCEQIQKEIFENSLLTMYYVVP